MDRITLASIVAGQTFWECQEGHNLQWLALESARVDGVIVKLRARRADTGAELELFEDTTVPQYGLRLFSRPQYTEPRP